MGIEADDGSVPIACSLTPEDLRDRGAAWRRLLGSGLVKGRRVRGGVRLIAGDGARATLLELVELERACCPWMGVEIGADGVTLTSTSPDGRAALAAMYLGIPFLRLLSTRRFIPFAGVGLAALVCAVACAIPVAIAVLVAGTAGVWIWRKAATARAWSRPTES